MVIISIVSGSRDPIAWNSALCSESIGNTIEPVRRAALHYDVAGADQRLLVGESDRASGCDRGEGRTQSRRADDGRDHEIGLAQGGFLNRVGAGGDFNRPAG